MLATKGADKQHKGKLIGVLLNCNWSCVDQLILETLNDASKLDCDYLGDVNGGWYHFWIDMSQWHACDRLVLVIDELSLEIGHIK